MTTSATLTLSDFLRACFAEDEAVAAAAVARNGATWSTDDLSGGTRITGTTEFGNPRSYRGDARLWDDEGAMGMFAETATHVVRWDPARVLAKCRADRLIVEEHEMVPADLGSGFGCGLCTCHHPDGPLVTVGPCPTLQALALPYADHPQYDEAWRP